MSAIGRMWTVLTLPFRSTAGRISLINKGKISSGRIVKYAVACDYPLNAEARAYIDNNPRVLNSNAAVKKLAGYAVDDSSKAQEYILERQEIHAQAVKALRPYLNDKSCDKTSRPVQFHKRAKTQRLLREIQDVSTDSGLKAIIKTILAEAPSVVLVASRVPDRQRPLR